MALSFNFRPANGPYFHTQAVKKFREGFHVNVPIEVAQIIRERMASKGFTPDDLCELYKKNREDRGIKIKEPEANLLSKFRHMPETGFVPKRLRPFVYEKLEITEDALSEALAQQELRIKMSDALGYDHAAEYFLQNLPLILKHSDFVMKYREFASIQLSNTGFSWCWLSGRFVCLGELLYFYKHGYGIVRQGCVHCGGDVYNYWCSGSPLSGARSSHGICVSCGHKAHNATRSPETTSETESASQEATIKYTPYFGPLSTIEKYTLPTTHVPCEFVDENPWEIFSLVALLKML